MSLFPEGMEVDMDALYRKHLAMARKQEPKMNLELESVQSLPDETDIQYRHTFIATPKSAEQLANEEELARLEDLLWRRRQAEEAIGDGLSEEYLLSVERNLIFAEHAIYYAPLLLAEVRRLKSINRERQ